ncbi:UNVERIFIED_ORG: hypothetical protein ABIB63_001686 [Xanthomonas axonopodis]
MADNKALSDFKLWADGKPAATARKLGMLLDDGSKRTPPRSPPPAGPRTMSPPLPHRPRRRTDANRCPHWVDGDGPARFTLDAYFVWQQEFPAKVRVQIRHRYTQPVHRHSAAQQGVAGVICKDTCIEPTTQASMQRREDKDGLEWTNLCYVRTNGNHWNGPIKQATACVEAGMLAQARLHRRAQRLLPAGIDTVALLPRTRHRCGPCPARRTAPARWESCPPVAWSSG